MQEFSDITLPGETEQKQSIPPRNISADELIHGFFPTDGPHSSFFRDMQKYVSIEGKTAAFAPFNIYWPTYEHMSKRQQAWYFYWRTQVRQGNYLDTDVSYIYLFIYEILSGVGWRTPQDGYEYLSQLVLHYQDTFPTLILNLPDWTFDFAESYGLEHTLLFRTDSFFLSSPTKIDILIEQHADDLPLTLPFALIDVLCNYSITESVFYNGGNQELMQETIQRVLALADAGLHKGTQKGFLQTYGPERPKEQEYYAFRNALCPHTDKKVKGTARAYSTSKRLREQITGLVRYTEHALWELKGDYDHLDHEIAKLVTLFLRHEYGYLPPKISVRNGAFILPDDMDAFTAPYIAISDKAEDKQISSSQTVAAYELIHTSFLRNYSGNDFFVDMLKYASFEGEPAPFVSFDISQPTYTDMNMKQEAWYFYWRSQVRQGIYLETDLTYILLYIYEIINGVGWKIPQIGYECLERIMLEYQNTFPDLDRYVPDWIFDFAQLHGLKHTLSLKGRSVYFIPHPKLNLLIDQYAEDVPFKLPFALIELLCNHSFEKNKFYNDGNRALMQEAIPRVVALVDAILRKKTQTGFLQTYGPEYPRKQRYHAFEKAHCLRSNKIITVTVKPYTVHVRLKDQISELARHAENTLREIKGYRSRLRGIWLDDETAKIITSFLKQEYGQSPLKDVEITLNFGAIATLRKESDAVRAALEVEDIDSVENKDQIKIHDAKDVLRFFDMSTLPSELKEVIECLTQSQQKALHTLLTSEHPERDLEQIADESMTMPQILLDEINETALQILGDLLIESDQEPHILDEYIPHLKQALR